MTRPDAERDARRMPIMDRAVDAAKVSVPLDLLSEEWAQRNHGQSLDRLRERGGMSACEVAANLERRAWRPLTFRDALVVLKAAGADARAENERLRAALEQIRDQSEMPERQFVEKYRPMEAGNTAYDPPWMIARAALAAPPAAPEPTP